MSNDPAEGHHVDALQRFGDICRETAREDGGDKPVAWTRVRDRLNQLSEQDRAEIKAVLRAILDFRPPTSRSSQ